MTLSGLTAMLSLLRCCAGVAAAAEKDSLSLSSFLAAEMYWIDMWSDYRVLSRSAESLFYITRHSGV